MKGVRDLGVLPEGERETFVHLAKMRLVHGRYRQEEPKERPGRS